MKVKTEKLLKIRCCLITALIAVACILPHQAYAQTSGNGDLVSGLDASIAQATCYMFPGIFVHKHETAYYSPVRSYKAPSQCPRSTNYVRNRINSWAPFIRDKYGLEGVLLDNKSSRTYCECKGAGERNNSVQRAKKFADDTKSEFFERYPDYKLIEVPDFHP